MPDQRHRFRAPRALPVIAAAIAAIAMALPASTLAAANPVLAGSVSDSVTLPGALSVAISGNYAYTTGYYPGELTAIDISNPAQPTIAGSSASSNGLLNASTVNVSGGYAFVVSKNRNGPSGSGSNDDGSGNSLTILDIATNPARPTIVGSIRDAAQLFGAYGVAVSGQYAYVASQGCVIGQPCPNPSAGNSFAVVDLSAPSAPAIVAELRNPALPSPWNGSGALGHATSVSISGHYAYVTSAYTDRLTVIDISNPLRPTIAGSLHDTTNLRFPVDVAVAGNYAYVVDQISTGRLTVVDISNPASPKIVVSLLNSSLNGAYRVRVQGDFAYVSASSVHAVAVVDISNPLAPRLAAAYSDATRLNRTTGLDVDPTGHYVIAVSPYLSTQHAPNNPPYPLQPGGPTLTGTVTAITLDPTSVTASITPGSEPPSSTAQTSANFSFTSNESIVAMRCQIDGGPFIPCSSPGAQSYASLSGGAHTFTVQASDAAGDTATSGYAWSILPPANTGLPTIAGSAQPGQSLTASSGSWTGSPSFAYQWLRCDTSGANCASISGATSSTYSVQTADDGSTLSVQVTGTTSAGAAVATSAPTAVVSGGGQPTPPANTTAPALTGGPAVEAQTLTATNGTWTGNPAPAFGYQWQRCDQAGQSCAPIAGATSQAYTLVSADVGSAVDVVVTGTNPAGSTPADSAASAVVTSAPGPVTALLDGFNRPNNSGPPGPNWTHMLVSSTGPANNLFIVNGQLTGVAGSNADYFNPQTFGPNSEDWITVATKPTADQDPVVLGLRFQNPGLATASGYQAYYIHRSSQPDQYRIIVRVNGNTSTILGTAAGPTLNSGDQLLFRAIGTTLELWRLDAGSWTRILTATDSTYQSAGYLDLTARDGAVRLANFGGGTLP